MIRFLTRLQPWAIMLLRISAGFALVYYSKDKVYPAGGFHHGNWLAPEQKFNAFIVHLGMPGWLGYFSTASEFLGGLALIVGFLTRFSSAMILINMLVALVTVNIHNGYRGSETTLDLIVMSFLLLTTGAGKLSLDRRLGLS